MGRLDRISNSKAANIVIVAGLVIMGAAVLSGLLNAQSDQFNFASASGEVALTERLQTFLNTAMNGAPIGALVVAVGFALRTMSQRTPPVAPTPGASGTPTLPVPFEDVPVQLPNLSPITIDVVQSPADDDVWRR